MECYKPIAKQAINIPAGIVIELFYGFVITGIYIIIIQALPTDSGIVKGLTYGLGMWFFRVCGTGTTNFLKAGEMRTSPLPIA